MTIRPQYPPEVAPFVGPTLKLRRAEEHIRDLNLRITDYLARRPYRVSEDLYTQPGEYNLRLKVLEWPPHEWGPLIGDVLTNLRAALDHAVYDLTIAKTGKPLKGTGFPILGEPSAWDALDARGKPRQSSGTGLLRGVHEMAMAEIERMQPYNSREGELGHRLSTLSKLVNADKHRTLTVCGSTIKVAVLHHVPGVQHWVTGRGPFIDGQPLASLPMAGDEKPNFQLDLAFDVAFDHRSPVPGELVAQTLRILADSVIEVLAELIRFVAV